MVKIITDSSAYMTRREAETSGVAVVPITYIADGALFYEGYSDENADLEALLKSDKDLTTSQPSPAAFESVFQKELAKGNEVLCLTLSSRLSGTYSSACIAAAQLDSDRVFVFDSLFSAGGLYLLVQEAVRLSGEGRSAADIVRELTGLRDKTDVVFTLDDMTRLRKSGRIGFVRMNVGTYLNIMPILRCKDGMIVADGVVRGKNNAVKKLADYLPAGTKDIVINDFGPNQVSNELCAALSKRFPDIDIKLRRMGPVLGAHLGPSAVALSYIA
ncbi:MAG TPA: DegV family protein [Candidatus Acidoferrum sp.]|nr:DegV family protein [Candidatus Acidoferrum sp.]